MDLAAYLACLCCGRHRPTLVAPSVERIPYAELKRRGVRLLIFDMDDTLGEFHGEVPETSIALLARLRREFSVAVLTNAGRARRAQLRRLMPEGVFVADFGSKPAAGGFRQVLRQAGVAAGQACMIGDRIGTDIWGAGQAGIPSRILVGPYSDRGGRQAPWPYRILRSFENRFFS